MRPEKYGKSAQSVAFIINFSENISQFLHTLNSTHLSSNESARTILRTFAPIATAHLWCARYSLVTRHSRPQRPCSFWSAPRIATSGRVQHRKPAIHGLPVTLRMLRVKSDNSDWFRSRSIVFAKPFKTGMLLD